MMYPRLFLLLCASAASSLSTLSSSYGAVENGNSHCVQIKEIQGASGIDAKTVLVKMRDNNDYRVITLAHRIAGLGFSSDLSFLMDTGDTREPASEVCIEDQVQVRGSAAAQIVEIAVLNKKTASRLQKHGLMNNSWRIDYNRENRMQQPKDYQTLTDGVMYTPLTPPFTREH